MNYNNLITDVCNEFNEIKTLYTIELEKDNLDYESGPHTVFSFVFVPLLKNAIKNNDILAKKMFKYLEKMENSEDLHVSEVAEFTVLEEIADNFSDEEVVPYMGAKTLESFNLIRRYIKGM